MVFVQRNRCLSSQAPLLSTGGRFSHSAPVRSQKWRSRRQRNVAKARLTVQANGLNKWGDRDAREGDTDPGVDDDGFEKDTMKVLSRVLTARSVQRLVMQLQETDIRVSSWLAGFCSENPPMDGDKFLQKLLRAQPTTIKDKITGKEKEISPSDIADRLIIVRHSLAKSMGSLPQYIAACNLEVYRKHVESGIVQEKPKYRRR